MAIYSTHPGSASVAPRNRIGRRFTAGKRWLPYYIMLLPGLLYFFIWHYVPILGLRLAFEQFRIIPPNIWVGLRYFYVLFGSPIFYHVISNTIIISVMKLLFVFPAAIIVALLLNEVRGSAFRTFVQSIIYLPHFLSWVVIASIFLSILSPPEGGASQVLGWIGMSQSNPLTNPAAIRWVLVVSENWRSAGWDSLLYLSAIIAIDPGLYEAAKLDGANRWQIMRHITIPGIAPTIATLFILNVGASLSADLNQVINFQNDINLTTIDIVDTYVYRIGLSTGEYSLATAAGIFKAIFGMILISSAHILAKRLTGKGIW